MCFSPEASFAAGAGLSVMGVLTIRRAPKGPMLLIALIPSFFAVQQLSEGVVWLHLDDGFENTSISWTARSIYLFFAYVFWLTYLPYAMWRNEKILWRRRTCMVFVLIALTGAVQNLYSIFTADWVPQVVCNSVDYLQPSVKNMLIYGVIIFTPLLLSSVPKMRIYGLLTLLLYIVSYAFYLETFTSVWCFFAAIASVFIYLVVDSSNNHKPS